MEISRINAKWTRNTFIKIPPTKSNNHIKKKQLFNFGVTEKMSFKSLFDYHEAIARIEILDFIYTFARYVSIFLPHYIFQDIKQRILLHFL